MEDSKLSVLFAFIVYSALMWIALLITSMYCYTRICLALRSHIKEHLSRMVNRVEFHSYTCRDTKRQCPLLCGYLLPMP